MLKAYTGPHQQLLQRKLESLYYLYHIWALNYLCISTIWAVGGATIKHSRSYCLGTSSIRCSVLESNVYSPFFFSISFYQFYVFFFQI